MEFEEPLFPRGLRLVESKGKEERQDDGKVHRATRCEGQEGRRQRLPSRLRITSHDYNYHRSPRRVNAVAIASRFPSPHILSGARRAQNWAHYVHALRISQVKDVGTWLTQRQSAVTTADRRSQAGRASNAHASSSAANHAAAIFSSEGHRSLDGAARPHRREIIVRTPLRDGRRRHRNRPRFLACRRRSWHRRAWSRTLGRSLCLHARGPESSRRRGRSCS
jgi:hypothetical protein